MVIETNVLFLNSDIDQPAFDRLLNLWRRGKIRPDICLNPHDFARLDDVLERLDRVILIKQGHDRLVQHLLDDFTVDHGIFIQSILMTDENDL